MGLASFFIFKLHSKCVAFTAMFWVIFRNRGVDPRLAQAIHREQLPLVVHDALNQANVAITVSMIDSASVSTKRNNIKL